jgi:hypothetical protein
MREACWLKYANRIYWGKKVLPGEFGTPAEAKAACLRHVSCRHVFCNKQKEICWMSSNALITGLRGTKAVNDHDVYKPSACNAVFPFSSKDAGGEPEPERLGLPQGEAGECAYLFDGVLVRGACDLHAFSVCAVAAEEERSARLQKGASDAEIETALSAIGLRDAAVEGEGSVRTVSFRGSVGALRLRAVPAERGSFLQALPSPDTPAAPPPCSGPPKPISSGPAERPSGGADVKRLARSLRLLDKVQRLSTTSNISRSVAEEDVSGDSFTSKECAVETTAETGATCYFNENSNECAVCKPGYCQCYERYKQRCVVCGRNDFCKHRSWLPLCAKAHAKISMLPCQTNRGGWLSTTIAVNGGSPLSLNLARGQNYDAWVESETSEEISSVVLAVNSDSVKFCGVWKDGEPLSGKPFSVQAETPLDFLHLPSEFLPRDCGDGLLCLQLHTCNARHSESKAAFEVLVNGVAHEVPKSVSAALNTYDVLHFEYSGSLESVVLRPLGDDGNDDWCISKVKINNGDWSSNWFWVDDTKGCSSSNGHH